MIESDSYLDNEVNIKYSNCVVTKSDVWSF